MERHKPKKINYGAKLLSLIKVFKMDIMIKFKELIITDGTTVNEVCKRIEKRNPDITIDEAYENEIYREDFV